MDLTFGGTLGLSYGPVLEINWDLDWLGLEDGEYSLCTMEVGATISTSGEITGTATVDCLGGFISGLGEVSGSSGSISVTGSFSMLKDAITITGVMTSNTGGVTISGEGRMQVPKSDYFGWLGGTGLSVTVFANLGDKNTPLAQRYILAWEEITFFGNKFTVGFKCNFEGHVELLGNSDLLGGDELFGSKGPGLVAHSVASPGDNGDMPTASETCTISDCGVTLFQFNFTVSSAWASLVYGGVEYTQGEIYSGQYGNMQIVDELSNDSRLTIAVNNAGLGEWTLNAYGDYGATFGAYALTGVAPSPVIDAVELGDDARSATINYSLADLSALENAVVSIFMDEADSGDYSGMLIGQFAAEAATGTYEYALNDEMNGGDYAFYVMVSSDNYAPVFSELSDALSFRYFDVEAPDQIQHVDVEWRSTGTTLAWDGPYDNIGVAGYKVAYRASDENEWSEADTATAYFVFADVPNGTYAYRVAAYDAEGNLAAWSEEGSVFVNNIANATYTGGNVAALAALESAYNVNFSGVSAEDSLVANSSIGDAELGGRVADSVIDGNALLLDGAAGYGLTVNGTLTVGSNGNNAGGEADTLAASVTADGVTVNDGGALIVVNGGAAGNVTVNAGGLVMLWDDAEFFDLALDYGATLRVAANGTYRLTGDVRMAGTIDCRHYIDTNGYRLVFEQYRRDETEQSFTYDLDKLLGQGIEMEIDSTVYGNFTIADKAANFNGTITVTDHASGYSAKVGFDDYTPVGNALCKLTKNYEGALLLLTSRFAIDAPTVDVEWKAWSDGEDSFSIMTHPAYMSIGTTTKCIYRYSLNEDMSDAVEVVNETSLGNYSTDSIVLQKADLVPNATYYVQTCTESEYGLVSPWSNTASFKVVPKYHTPVPKSVAIDDRSWAFYVAGTGLDASVANSVERYIFRYADNPEMENAVEIGEYGHSSGCGYTYVQKNQLVAGKDYYFQARIRNNKDYAYGDWSEAFVFNTEAPVRMRTVIADYSEIDTFKFSAGGGSISVSTDVSALNFYSMPECISMTCSAYLQDSDNWSAVAIYNNAYVFSEEPMLLQSNADGLTDVFFAQSHGIWEGGYQAFHRGTAGGWTGTGENILLDGRNKLCDIIEGSEDANVLAMTDDANGDALFVDDIYSALPGEINAQQSRLAKIDEIRAGAGDDVVDLTSQRFAYIGEGVTIRGGLGNDVIWANGGSNCLFGDAGDDRLVGASGNDVLAGGTGNDSMHGGGGDDVFAFGGDWGQDRVEQLASGTVTLWFQEGSIGNWNEETLTYTDGDNSVTVVGVARESITLRFGNEAARYGELLAAGAFSEATSERIFEDKAMLA